MQLIKAGHKVYLTLEAVQKLEHVLKKYGIELRDAYTIQHPHVLIHVTNSNKCIISFKHSPFREGLQREIQLQLFIQHL